MLFHAIPNAVGRKIYAYTGNPVEFCQPDEKLSFSTGDIEDAFSPLQLEELAQSLKLLSI
jgi:hypothetical protein